MIFLATFLIVFGGLLPWLASDVTPEIRSDAWALSTLGASLAVGLILIWTGVSLGT